MTHEKSASRLAAFVAVVVIAGATVAVSALTTWKTEDVALLASLAAVAAVSEICDFALPGNSRVSVSIAPLLAAATFAGLQGALIVALALAATDYTVHRKPTFKGVFNLAALLIAGAAHVGVLELFSPLYDSGDWVAMLGPVIAGSAIAYLLNSGLIAAAISLETGGRALAIWDENFRWIFPYYIILGVIALSMVIAYSRWDIAGLALLLIPLAMTWLALRQYVWTAYPTPARAD